MSILERWADLWRRKAWADRETGEGNAMSTPLTDLERLTGRRAQRAPEPEAAAWYPSGPQESKATQEQRRLAMENSQQTVRFPFVPQSAENIYPNGLVTNAAFQGKSAGHDGTLGPNTSYPRVSSTALRYAARRLVELSRDGDAAAVGYELRLLATFVVAPAAEDAQDREAMERGNSRTGEKP